MFLTMFKSKIHRASITEANLNYMGSITIDEKLMEAAHLIPNEKVQVVNVNNGARLETYAIPGKAGSGIICLNGAAARHACEGDSVIIISYALMSKEEAASHKPKVVLVDEKNNLVEIRQGERHGDI